MQRFIEIENSIAQFINEYKRNYNPHTKQNRQSSYSSMTPSSKSQSEDTLNKSVPDLANTFNNERNSFQLCEKSFMQTNQFCLIESNDQLKSYASKSICSNMNDLFFRLSPHLKSTENKSKLIYIYIYICICKLLV